MRRFLAYISLFIVTILGIGFSIKPTILGLNNSLDYEKGKELVFQLTERGTNIADSVEEFEQEGAVEDIAEEMTKRLETYGIQQYNIQTEGLDTIRVSLHCESETIYRNIASYLAFDGRLTIATSDFEYQYSNYEDPLIPNADTTMFGKKDAYLDFKNAYPGVVIPLEDADEFKKAVDHAKSLNKATDNEDGTPATEISEEAYLYLWSDWEEGDSFETAAENDNIKNKLVLRFDYQNIWWEDKEEDHSSICVMFNITDKENVDSVEDLNYKDVVAANENAKFYTSLMNASKLDYKVNFIYSENISPIVDNTINSGMILTPVFNSTLIGFSFAYVLALLLGILFYRLAGAGVVLTSALSTTFILSIFNALGGSFGVPAVIGLGLYMIVSLAAGFIYLQKIKENVISGQSIKKANTEASKRTIMIALDASVALLIFGSLTYLLGGTYIANLGVILFIGSFINLLFNVIYQRLGLFFLTNSELTEKKPILIGINKKSFEEYKPDEEIKDNVLAKDVDQKEEKAKAKNTSAVYALVLATISLIGIISMITFTFTSSTYNGSNLYDTSDKIFIRVEDEKTTLKDSGDVEEILDKYSVPGAAKEYKIYDSIDTKEYSATTNPSTSGDSIKIDYIYYIVTIDSEFDIENTKFSYEGKESTIEFHSSIVDNFSNLDNNAITSVKKSSSVNLEGQFRIVNVVIATSISMVTLFVYYALRYKLSYSIAATLINIAVTTISITLFSLLRTPVNGFVLLIPIAISFLTMLMSSIILESYSYLIKDVRVKNFTIDVKKDTMNKAFNDVRLYLYGFLGIVAITIIAFLFGGALELQNTYIFIMLMSLVGTLCIEQLLVPFGNLILKFFDHISNDMHLKNNKKSNLKREHKARQKSTEVEEATFIGIND